MKKVLQHPMFCTMFFHSFFPSIWHELLSSQIELLFSSYMSGSHFPGIIKVVLPSTLFIGRIVKIWPFFVSSGVSEICLCLFYRLMLKTNIEASQTLRTG